MKSRNLGFTASFTIRTTPRLMKLPAFTESASRHAIIAGIVYGSNLCALQSILTAVSTSGSGFSLIDIILEAFADRRSHGPLPAEQLWHSRVRLSSRHFARTRQG